MARYGMDYGRGYERNQDRWGGQGWMGGDRGYSDRGYGGGYGGGGGFGGMRSEEWGPGRDEFGGGRWYGEAYGGGMGGGMGGYDSMYGGGMGGYDAGMGGMGGRSFGGYGGRDTGYMGRDMGYTTGEGMGMGRGRQQARTRAAELMTENPECVTADATIAEVAQKMRDLDVGIIPVVESMENRRLRGVITDRDIAVRAVAEGRDGKAKVADCMTATVETVNKNDSAEEVLNLMGREQVRRVPVTDREGRLVGIIAQADLALDYGDGGSRQDLRVERTIERISEPERGGARRGGSSGRAGGQQSETAMAAQGRQGGQTGGGTGNRGRQAEGSER